jgi:hypothetical protein
MGRVTGTAGPGPVGEVGVRVRGGAERFLAHPASAVDRIETGTVVTMVEHLPPRTVHVTPAYDSPAHCDAGESRGCHAPAKDAPVSVPGLRTGAHSPSFGAERAPCEGSACRWPSASLRGWRLPPSSF